jgi:tetratricopeptide (TPR) repeat protein
VTQRFKKSVILGCLILASLMSFTYLNAMYAQGMENKHLTAEMLISIMEAVDRRVLEIFRQLEARGVLVPNDAQTKYYGGLLLANDSATLLGAGNPGEASKKAVEALQLYKEALMIAQETLGEEPPWPEIVAERSLILRDSITRAYEYLRRLENLTKLARAEGFNSTMIETKIVVAKRILEDAVSNLKVGYFDQVVDDLAAARALILQSSGQVRRLAEERKVQTIEVFLGKTQERLSDLKETVDSLSSNLSPQVKNASLVALNEAEGSLQRAEGFLEQRMISETIDELSNAREKEEETITLLKSAGVAADTSQSGESLTLEMVDEPQLQEP